MSLTHSLMQLLRPFWSNFCFFSDVGLCGEGNLFISQGSQRDYCGHVARLSRCAVMVDKEVQQLHQPAFHLLKLQVTRNRANKHLSLIHPVIILLIFHRADTEAQFIVLSSTNETEKQILSLFVLREQLQKSNRTKSLF